MPPQEKTEVQEETAVEKPAAQEARWPIKSLRTYQGDINEAVARDKVSTATILVAEQKRKERIETSPSEPIRTETRNKLFLWVGALLFILGIAALGAVYYVRSKEKVVQIQKTKALIAFSKEKILLTEKTTRDKFMQNIIDEKNSFAMPTNSVLYIDPVDEKNASTSIDKVLSLLTPNMSGSLSRSFDPAYMIGVYSSGVNEPFILLTTSDYASSYSGMLKWEKDMPFDLGELFGVSQSVATTSAFIDEAYHNKDLRVLQDKSRKTVLLYSFIDRNTLLITTDEDTFAAIVGKYLISQQTR